jgi:hypothetical protein
MLRRRTLLSLALLLATFGCDNVGRAFDPDVGGEDPEPEPTASTVQVLRDGGDARDGRPRVRATYPEDSGWPTTVPIVVEFSESVNEASIAPTSPAGLDGKVVLRVQGTTTVLPCQYDFLASGKLLVLRPVQQLSNTQTPTYEVVLLPDARDADGVRFDVPSGGTVLSEFQVNQGETLVDGRVLALFPRDNEAEATRETDVVLVFDRPANVATLVPANLQLRRTGGTAVETGIATPIGTAGVNDPRIVRLRPSTPLAADLRHELVLTAGVTFGAEGELDFRGRTPFARFDTVAPAEPTAVVVGNPLPGFDNKINRGNFATATLVVTTPADAVAGDVVRARIYGGDRNTLGTGDLAFLERTATVPADGAQNVAVDFSGTLGSLERGRFDDGDVVFSVQLQRGNQRSGFVRNDEDDEPVFDLTPPTLATAGPPANADGTDLWSDIEFAAFYGRASERLAAASLVDGVNPAVTLVASDASGQFLLRPLALGRLTAPRGYQLALTDRSGNESVAIATGNLVQRGFVTGVLVDQVTVLAYDQVTLQPIVGATVLLDGGEPTLPATARTSAVTNANGFAVFTNLTAADHTITVLRDGYDLVTLYRTQAAFASLPLRPLANATATLQGNLVLQAAAGSTVVVGATAVDDRSVLGVRSTSATPTRIPDVAIVPNRPNVLTAFASVGEPATTPTFTAQGFQTFGATLLVPTPPAAPASPGGTSTQTLTLLPSSGAVLAQIAPFVKDFGLATGLDTTNLVGGKPLARVTVSLLGFEGQALVGLGAVTSSSGTQYSINSTTGLPAVAGFAAFGPVYWVTTEARDNNGRISRHRGFLDAVTGQVAFLLEPPAIPGLTAPGAPASGSPRVEFLDVMDPTNPAFGGGGLATVDLVARSAEGRSWRLLALDRDGIGGVDTVQFPDVASAGVAGLAPGAWTIQAEARTFLSVTASTADDFMLTERVRQEVLYSRSATQSFTVQ